MSMFLLGGICFIFFAQQGIMDEVERASLETSPLCTAFVVSAEFITGIIVNKVMGWNVWNYTDQPFHLMGQICFPFAVLFSGLCTFGIIISGYLLCYLYREIKPGFHIL